jgi:hypothetical protein
MPFATPLVLILLYCVFIPAFAFNFAKGVVKKRPPTYEPPEINDNSAELPKKWQMRLSNGFIDARLIAVFILIIGFSVSVFLSLEGFPPKSIYSKEQIEEGVAFQIIPADKQWNDIFKDKGPNYFEKVAYDLYLIQLTEGFGGGIKEGDFYVSLIKQGEDPGKAYLRVIKEKLQFTSAPNRDPTKYLLWSGLMLTIVCAFCFLLYHRNIYKRGVQLQIMQMEDEFKESMYMIASRMGENKPVENALKQAKDFLPNLMVSKRIFGKTVENIELMGLPLENAVFDPVYGAMKGIPSKIISTAMRLLVDSVTLGVEVASRTLMSLSLQMENMDKVNKSLKELVSDVTTTMQTMALFIAPMVLGITTALQKVVMMTLASVVSSNEMDQASLNDIQGIGNIQGLEGMGQMNVNSLFKVNVQTFASFATPLMYMVIIGIYVALIVIILTYFTTKIKEDNDLLFKINLSKALPIAMAVYFITTIIANIAVSSVMQTV